MIVTRKQAKKLIKGLIKLKQDEWEEEMISQLKNQTMNDIDTFTIHHSVEITGLAIRMILDE